MRHLRRRHGLKTAGSPTDFYRKLDPRECNLDIDDATMTSIFGPPKRKLTDAVNYTAINKRLKINRCRPSKAGSDEESDDIARRIESVQVKIECEEGNEQEYGEVQPTDFVSVKIECAEVSEVEEEMENSEEEN